MKDNAILINTARGALLDSTALVNALRDNAIGGAAIDVLTHEPPVDGDPLLDYEGENLLLTPHIAWATRLRPGKMRSTKSPRTQRHSCGASQAKSSGLGVLRAYHLARPHDDLAHARRRDVVGLVEIEPAILVMFGRACFG